MEALSQNVDSLKLADKVEIFVSCRNLKSIGMLSKGDPFVRLYTENNGKYELHSETEFIKENLNPNFAKSFILEYYFELKQRLRFEVLSHDEGSKHTLVGSTLTSLNELMGAKNQTSIFDITNSKQEKNGKLILQCEKVQECSEILTLEISAENLPKTTSILPGFLPGFKIGFLGYTSSYLKFYRSREDGTWVLVHQTLTVQKNQSPKWNPFVIPVQKLSNGDHYRPIKIECLSDAGTEQIVLGEATFSINDLVVDRKTELKLKSAKFKDPVIIKFKKAALRENPNFIEYLRGGIQLSVVCAIDYTGSNGDPSSPRSLHAMKYDSSLNEYQKAILGVCDILLSYDYDKLVPVYGFGGKPKFPNYNTGVVSHCFSCTGNPSNAEVFGLQGILEAYSHALNNVELAGPTLFAPIITETMKVARQNKEKGSEVYTILLILTDGEIYDMENTISCLINSAKLPLSIIIVGIGNADFTNMEILDGDDGLVNSNGVKAERDLVQFVPFKNFSGNQEALAREVLQEIPAQLVQYMELIGKKPEKAKKIDIDAFYTGQGPVIVDQKEQAKGFTDNQAKQVSYPNLTMNTGYNLVGKQLQNLEPSSDTQQPSNSNLGSDSVVLNSFSNYPKNPY